MIDLHTHILPGLDDGAADIYDTLEMAEIAVRSGVTAMAATPHCNIPGVYHNYYGEEYIQVFQKAERALNEEGIPLTLYAGMEVFVTEDLPRLLREGKILTINAGRYLLVEFSFEEDPQFVERMLQKIQELGLTPIIAHPERYEFVKEDPLLVSEWKRKGYEIQINKGSLQGRFGRRIYYVAHELLQKNLVTVVASDAHSPFQRTPNLADVYEELAEDYPESYLQVLFQDNPMRICHDQPLITR